MNIYQRHGARVKIATAADFQGNRWTNTAVMLPTPRAAFLTPAGSIARPFQRHNGTHAVSVRQASPELDIAASRTGNRLYLHVANLEYRRSVEATFSGTTGGRVFEIAPEDLRSYVNQDQPEVFRPSERTVEESAWRFPPGSVSALELDLP